MAGYRIMSAPVAYLAHWIDDLEEEIGKFHLF